MNWKAWLNYLTVQVGNCKSMSELEKAMEFEAGFLALCGIPQDTWEKAMDRFLDPVVEGHPDFPAAVESHNATEGFSLLHPIVMGALRNMYARFVDLGLITL